MKPKTIYESKDKTWRILEVQDYDFCLEDLKGDCYNPKENPSIPEEQLKKEEREFEKDVELYGVYGYILEKWNAAPGIGYEYIESHFGFVGQYDPSEERFNHDIVEEFKSQAQGKE